MRSHKVNRSGSHSNRPAPSDSQPSHSWARRFLPLGLILVGFTCAYALTTAVSRSPVAPKGMVLIPAGEFQMGTAGTTIHKNEQPAHKVRLDAFYMDETEVTNAEFREYVEATGYMTTAEKQPDWEEMRKQLPPGTPKPPDDQLVAGSLVFSQPAQEVSTDDASHWWKWTPGACWNHPEGPGSDLVGREDHPVAHVSWDDATAFAEWAGKRLPTEAEWEYATRGALTGKRFVWGNADPTEESPQCNIWHGTFPNANTKPKHRQRTMPVKSFAPNGYGLYDMAGNVWEWCADWYRADAYARRGGAIDNPTGPTSFWDPREPLVPKRVTRGGSFLCHASYCESYRPAARRGTAADTGMSHIGFRCVISKSDWESRK